MKVRISKLYRGDKHVGFKKTVGGHEWTLCYGTSPADEAKAIRFATALDAKWQLLKIQGQSHFSRTDFEEVKALVAGAPSRAPLPQPLVNRSEEQLEEHATRAVAVLDAPNTQITELITSESSSARRWLFEALDEVVLTVRSQLRPDGSNGDHVLNTCERISRARDAAKDLPLDQFRRKELDELLTNLQQLTSKFTGKPLRPVTIRNLATVMRFALSKLAEWEWWQPPPLWEKAFKGFTIKKLMSPVERKRRKKRPETHGVDEKRVLWHLALDFEKAMMALADWAGHTQMEVATLALDEIKFDKAGEMYIDRDRHKTGVHGRWWIPPEPAAVIKRVIEKTPRDPAINPHGLAFLTPRNMPLVHRADRRKRARSDYVGSNVWSKLLRAARYHGVRHISFKFMRKGTAQFIRDAHGKEVSRMFLAHADEDIQDEAYTRPLLTKLDCAIRQFHQTMKPMFEPIIAEEWPRVIQRIAEHKEMLQRRKHELID